MRPGRMVITRMYRAAARVKELLYNYSLMISKDFCSDLHWWQTLSVAGMVLVFLLNQWFQYWWSNEWSTVGIMAKKPVPIVILAVQFGAKVWLRKEYDFSVTTRAWSPVLQRIL